MLGCLTHWCTCVPKATLGLHQFVNFSKNRQKCECLIHALRDLMTQLSQHVLQVAGLTLICQMLRNFKNYPQVGRNVKWSLYVSKSQCRWVKFVEMAIQSFCKRHDM